MGRSGSTWLGDLVNHKLQYKEIFEPFFPSRVKQAMPFGYYKYLDTGAVDDKLFRSAKKLMGGSINNKWIKSGNIKSKGSGILIKDIRTNLMLSWIKHCFPSLKIVLLIRDPFEVAFSWVRLNWSKIPFENKSDLDAILSQESLLKAFPLISTWAENYKSLTQFESVVLEWCILNYVPLMQLKSSPNLLLVVKYFNLVNNPEEELKRLCRFIDDMYDDRMLQNLRVRSRTSFSDKDHKYIVSSEEISNSLSIINSFGLQDLICSNKAKYILKRN